MTESLKHEATVALFTYQLALEAELPYREIFALNLEHGLCAFCSTWSDEDGFMWELGHRAQNYCRDNKMMYMAMTLSDRLWMTYEKLIKADYEMCLQPRIDFLIAMLEDRVETLDFK